MAAHLEGAPEPVEDRERVKAQIRAAFDATPRPDNARLRGSSEGEEPFLLEDEYRDKSDWHGLDDETRGEKVNPRRYGDWTWFEAISERCAVFTPGEVSAIVAYLRYIAARDEFSRTKIQQALNNYWLPRLERP